MADDKKDRELIAELSNLMTLLWNASLSVEAAADDCKVKKGESLYDRIVKCEATVNRWEKEMSSLKDQLATVKKLLDAYPTKPANEASGLGETSYQLASAQHDSMKALLSKYVNELKALKQKVRKVKA